jgi:predicted NodU family carbamoyl transferase
VGRQDKKLYKMNYVGISCGFHDAALSIIDDNGNILFAGHSERYSMKKHDSELCLGIVDDVRVHINDDFQVHYYERPYVKAVRPFFAGQELGPFNA